LGLHVGDEQHAVNENRRRLEQSFALPSPPLWLNQIHGTDILSIESGEPHKMDADGAYTSQVDQVLAVLTADCLPVVISNVQGTRLAVVHAGWRGLANGVIANALQHFTSDDVNEIHAWLGPGIGAERFEVGEDVLQQFTKRNAADATHFKPLASQGKYMADLYDLARSELLRNGCASVAGGEYCTYSQHELFHSYRRDGKGSGRMATVAWISAA
jgi:YfiH family protein